MHFFVVGFFWKSVIFGNSFTLDLFLPHSPIFPLSQLSYTLSLFLYTFFRRISCFEQSASPCSSPLIYSLCISITLCTCMFLFLLSSLVLCLSLLPKSSFVLCILSFSIYCLHINFFLIIFLRLFHCFLCSFSPLSPSPSLSDFSVFLNFSSHLVSLCYTISSYIFLSFPNPVKQVFLYAYQLSMSEIYFADSIIPVFFIRKFLLHIYSLPT